MAKPKVVDYLLNPAHPEGVGKAEFFTHFGFNVGHWEKLAAALVAHAQENPVSSSRQSLYGTKYRIDGPLLCPNGRAPQVRVVWIVDSDSDAPRLVTAHPV